MEKEAAPSCWDYKVSAGSVGEAVVVGGGSGWGWKVVRESDVGLTGELETGIERKVVVFSAQ